METVLIQKGGKEQMSDSEGTFCKLYTDGSEESRRIAELLKRAKIAFVIVNEKGKVRPELLIGGDPNYPENWLTGEEAAEKWIEKIKKERGQG